MAKLIFLDIDEVLYTFTPNDENTDTVYGANEQSVRLFKVLLAKHIDAQIILVTSWVKSHIDHIFFLLYDPLHPLHFVASRLHPFGLELYGGSKSSSCRGELVDDWLTQYCPDNSTLNAIVIDDSVSEYQQSILRQRVVGCTRNGFQIDEYILAESLLEDASSTNEKSLIFNQWSTTRRVLLLVPDGVEHVYGRKDFSVQINGEILSLPDQSARSRDAQEEAVLELMTTKPRITATDVRLLLNAKRSKAGNVLRSLIDKHLIRKEGRGLSTTYVRM